VQLLTSFLTCTCGSSDPSATNVTPPRYPHVQRRKRHTPGCYARECDEERALAALLLESRPFSGGVWSIFIGRTPTHTPSSISNTRLIDGAPLPTLMDFTTFVAH
jgi:hypothetical protein